MRWLVIGIGNTLRRDDGIGPWLAERVAGWNIAAVRCVHQLTPELADDVARHDCVLFLDAAVEGTCPVLRRIEPAAAMHRLGHAFGPAELLGLAGALARPTPAWLAVVPGEDFRFGEGLSSAAIAACETMLGDIERLLRDRPP